MDLEKFNTAVVEKDDKIDAQNDKETEEGNKIETVQLKSEFKVPTMLFKSKPIPSKLNVLADNTQKTNGLISEAADATPKEKIKSEVEDDKKITKDKKATHLSADQLKQTSMPYKEPGWGGMNANSGKYKLEIIKQGSVIGEISLAEKSFFVFGRLPSCDHQMDHPNISRYHAVLQYRPLKTSDEASSEDLGDSNENSQVGWYLYDLDSTHGTWLNKRRIETQVYVRLRVGHVIKFGSSTRLFVLHGPEDDCEKESEMNVLELQELKRKTEMARQMKQLSEDDELNRVQAVESNRKDYCTWGMGDEEDIQDEDPDEVNPFAEPELLDESLYVDDPKKSVRGFFEREGLDAPKYEFIDDTSMFGGKKICRLELPIDTPTGQPTYAEVAVTGKQKEAVVACALLACRMLDKLGLFRKSKHEPRASKKRKNWAENDYYDSDEDTFLDRTGDIEKKREKRMKASNQKKAETYESLVAQLQAVISESSEIEQALVEDSKLCKTIKEEKDGNEDDDDALDAFMKSVKMGGLSAKTKLTMKSRLVELKHLRNKLESLVKISKPCDVKILPGVDNNSSDKKPGANVLFGKRQKISQLPVLKQEVKVKEEPSENHNGEEEEEDMEVAEKPQITQTVLENIKVEPMDIESPLAEQPQQDPTKSPLPISKSSKTTSNGTPVTKSTAGSSSQPPKSAESLRSPAKKEFSSRRDLSEASVLKKAKDKEAVWLPPEDQLGDGRTSLNDKLGY